MQKKLLVAAVLATLSGAAFSQAANVTLYGRLNVGMDTWSATGATDGNQNLERRTRVFDSGSRVGLRGTEDLGNGLRAFYQIETGVNIDSGTGNGQSGAANASSGTWASRSSFVGVGGSWGDVRFGRQDIYWTGGTVDQVGANYLHMGSNILSGFGGHVATPAARNSNVLSYNSPNWNGLTGSVYYNPSAEAVGVKGAAGAAAVTPKSRVWGVTARYNNGPFAVNFDWADNSSSNANSNVAGAMNNPKVTAWKLAGAWKYGNGQISLGYTDVKDTKATGLAISQTTATGVVAANAGAAAVVGTTGALAGAGAVNLFAYNSGDTLRQKNWLLGWEHTFGKTMVIAQYGRGGQVTGSTHAVGTGSSGHSQYTLGVRHNMSKRTAVYAAYVTMRNDSNSFSDFAGGGMSSAGAAGLANTSIGADPTSLGVGIWHQF